MAELPTIQTERLLSRPFALQDAAAVQQLAGDREIAASTLAVPHPYEDGMAEEWIGGHRSTWDDGRGLTLAIVRQADSRLIGAISLTLIQEHSRAELGYWIGRSYWGQGHCTEAAEALVDYGFAQLGLNRIEAWHFAENPASGRVIHKVGMLHEGQMRQRVRRWGEFKNLDFYAILRSDWEEGGRR
jgi:ribosomal-protein-alanine N-acetyltransferase